jgi:hypothetical protein
VLPCLLNGIREALEHRGGREISAEIVDEN